MLKNGVPVQLRIDTPFVLYQLNIIRLYIEIPIINLFKIHGSVSWKYLKDDNKVKEIDADRRLSLP